MSPVVGPNTLHDIISRISEGGSKHNIRKDIDPLLEKEGFVEGYFLNDRIKKFKMKNNIEKLKVEPEDLEVESNEEPNSDYLSDSNTLIIQRPNREDKNRKKFDKKLKELLDIVKIEMKNLELMQLHLVVQPADLANKQARRINKIKQKSINQD